MTATAESAAIEGELRLLDPAVRRDREAVARLLHPEFTEIGSSGRLWNRSEILDAMTGWDHATDVSATELDASALADGIVALTYLCTNAGRRTRRSSIWQRNGMTWRIRFHQGTPSGRVIDITSRRLA